MELTAPSMSQLQATLEACQRDFDEKPGYTTAVRLQRARMAINERASDARKQLVVVSGKGDLTNHDRVCEALYEIAQTLNNVRNENDLPGTLIYIQRVAKQAILSIGREENV